MSLLAGALQFAHVPDYSALILRRTYSDLNQPRALIPLATEWLRPALKRGEVGFSLKHSRFHFPRGATLSFGYVDNDRDLDQYQGAAFQYIAFDELGQHPENRYTYLFSRLRKPDNMACPLRMRGSANPGGVGHQWILNRFIDAGTSAGRVFVPATLDDNPSLDRESYERTLDRLDPVTKAQLRHGDWSIRADGNLFRREWFDGLVLESRPQATRTIRYWDLAATAQQGGNDPDYTAGVLMSIDAAGVFTVLDSVEERKTPADVERLVSTTASFDGPGVEIFIEEEGGASGKSLVSHYQRNVLRGYAVHGIRPSGDKITRAKPFSAACQNSLVRLVRGPWVGRFLDALVGFGVKGVHDDTADAANGAHAQLAAPRPTFAASPAPFAPKTFF